MRSKNSYVLAEELRDDLLVVNYEIKHIRSWKAAKGLFKLKIILCSWIEILES